MSKYAPLGRYLEHRHGEQTPMTFAEVERVLGFGLPPSARAHPTWWSNNPGTHVGVRAWRDAGFKTSRVDIAGEKVVFVRAPEETAFQSAPADNVTLSLKGLSPAARKLYEDYVADAAGDVSTAIGRAVHEAAVARRGRLIDSITRTGAPSPVSSVDLIREDRDAR